MLGERGFNCLAAVRCFESPNTSQGLSSKMRGELGRGPCRGLWPRSGGGNQTPSWNRICFWREAAKFQPLVVSRKKTKKVAHQRLLRSSAASLHYYAASVVARTAREARLAVWPALAPLLSPTSLAHSGGFPCLPPRTYLKVAPASFLTHHTATTPGRQPAPSNLPSQPI